MISVRSLVRSGPRPFCFVRVAALILSFAPLAPPRSVRATSDAAEAAQTVVVGEAIAVVHLLPRLDSPSRGTLVPGTRVATIGRVHGDGCRGNGYFALARGGYVCSRKVRLSDGEPGGVEQPVLRDGQLLPATHVSVRASGTPGFARPEDHVTGTAVESFRRGFGLVAWGRSVVGGIELYRLRRGTWVRASDVERVRASTFEGVILDEGARLDFGWLRGVRPALYDGPRGRVVRRGARHERVTIEAITEDHARLTDGSYVPLVELARVTVSEPPEGIGESERWIDVSLAEQTLVAYEGRRPVFAAAVSTGADRAGRRTPIGTFRIQSKHAEADMDDLDAADEAQRYLVEAVPWVQYFHGSIALHTAFWHDDFGTARSHGCVNLSPRDARFLFRFTEPTLEPGWSYLAPGPNERSTVVRVRP